MLLLLPAFTSAQPRQVEFDSLHRQLKQAVSDTIRMKVCGAFGRFYSESNRDSSLFYFEKAALIAKKLNLKLEEAAMVKWSAYILIQLRSYPKSLELHLQALKNIRRSKERKKHIAFSRW